MTFQLGTIPRVNHRVEVIYGHAPGGLQSPGAALAHTLRPCQVGDRHPRVGDINGAHKRNEGLWHAHYPRWCPGHHPGSGGVRGVRGRSWGGQRYPGYGWASAIDRIYMIKKVVGRASGTDLASTLKQKKFWMPGCVSVLVSVSVSVCVACPAPPLACRAPPGLPRAPLTGVVPPLGSPFFFPGVGWGICPPRSEPRVIR